MSDLFEIERQKTKERMKVDTQQAQVQNQQQENAMLQPEQERFKATVKASKLKFLTPKNIATRKKDKLGTKFKPAITKESKRESKINNKKSALYAKQRVLERVNYYEAGLENPLLEGGMEDMKMTKILPAAFTDENMAPEEKLQAQMKEILTFDLSKMDMSTDIAFTNQLNIIDSIYDMNNIFKAQAGANDFIDKMDEKEAQEYVLKSAQIEALKKYADARKMLLKDEYYASHYNSELSETPREGETDIDILTVAQLLRNVREAEEALSSAGTGEVEKFKSRRMEMDIAKAAKPGFTQVKNGSKIPFFTPHRLAMYGVGDDDYKKLSNIWEEGTLKDKWEKLGVKDEAVKKQFKDFYNSGINSFTEYFTITAERTALGDKKNALLANIEQAKQQNQDTSQMEADLARLQEYDTYLNEKAKVQQKKSDDMLVKFDTFMIEKNVIIDGDKDKMDAVNKEFEDTLQTYKDDESTFVSYKMECENGETVDLKVFKAIPMHLEGFKAKNKDAAEASVKELSDLYLSQLVYAYLCENNAHERNPKYYPDGKDNVRPKMAGREFVPAIMRMRFNATTSSINSKLKELDKLGSDRFESKEHSGDEYMAKASEIGVRQKAIMEKINKTKEDADEVNLLDQVKDYYAQKAFAQDDADNMQNNNEIVEKFKGFGFDINESETSKLEKLL